MGEQALVGAWQVLGTLLVAATLAFLIFFVLFVVVAVDIRDRRRTKEKLDQLEAIVFSGFEIPLKPKPWEGTEAVGDAGGDEGEVGGLLTINEGLTDEQLDTLLDPGRCCNLTTVGNRSICASCLHVPDCPGHQGCDGAAS